jgi:hypothetical protein
VKAAAAFKSLDKHRNGSLTLRNIIIGLRKSQGAATMLGLSQHVHEGKTRDQLMEEFAQMDRNHDEHVTENEFVDFVLKLHSDTG